MVNNIFQQAKSLNDWVIGFRRDFHANPEISNKEVRTSAIVAEQLEKMGIKVTRIGNTGVLGTLEGSGPGKVVALRADMDALPVTEKTGLPFSSKNLGVMHACGHDFHISMLLGAAKILSDMKGTLKGTVKFIFQPAEELGQGAKIMIEGGVLENPVVDMVFGMHVWSDVPVGKVAIQDGALMASAAVWSLTIKGVPSHGGMPWEGVDAVVCAVAVIQGLQTLVTRVNDAREPIVINVGTIHGGDRFNITPGKVELGGMNRAFSTNSRNKLPEWMETMIKNTCAAYRCEYEFKYDFTVNSLINEPASTAAVKRSVGKFMAPTDIIEIAKIMASEDFSEYLAVVPGTFMFLGGRNEAKDCCYSHHSDHFNIDEDCIPLGVASLAQVAADFLS